MVLATESFATGDEGVGVGRSSIAFLDHHISDYDGW